MSARKRAGPGSLEFVRGETLALIVFADGNRLGAADAGVLQRLSKVNSRKDRDARPKPSQTLASRSRQRAAMRFERRYGPRAW
jgi:hypothetical protein